MDRTPGGWRLPTCDTDLVRRFPYLGSARASSVRRRAPAREGRASTPSRSNAATRSAMVAWAAGLSRHKRGARRLRPSLERVAWGPKIRVCRAQHSPRHAPPRYTTPTTNGALPTHPVQTGASCWKFHPSVKSDLSHYLLPRSPCVCKTSR